ncbi:hypothetical protein CPC08DRAFT_769516 [Agrocybe pediades]|nr:hypothetical protein CPC08DRAFT_769516 [Agrocybe pediades]
MSISYVYFASTRLEMFAGKGAFSVAVPITAIIFVMLGQIVADGLMIWRSFHASGGSYSRVSPVILLFIAEVGLCVTSITLNILYNLHPTLLTVRSARRYNVIEGSSSIVTASTSILATFLIGHRIYSSTSSDPRSRQRYARIIEIIVHSSAIYSTAMLAQAICNLINTGDSNRSPALIVVTNYLTTLSVATASIAPTLMVARLGLEQRKEVDESYITSLTLPEDVAMQVVNFSDSRNCNPSDA